MKTIGETFDAVEHYRFPIFRHLGFNPEFPDIRLDIKMKHYRELEFASAHDLESAGIEAIRRDVKVPAVLRLDDESTPVNLRLKGDRLLHWSDPEHWSFRVKVKGDNSVFGMKRFSLHHAVARNYIYEWLFHAVLKREGIIGLRYRFVTLYVNGTSRGIYAVEEHFDKRLIENNRRREGPILQFDEDWVPEIKDKWAAMSVRPYERENWEMKDPETLAHAVSLLEGFRQGRFGVEEVFDVELLARYFAICDLLDMAHGATAKSIKFYFNPLTGRLEPIGYDGHFQNSSLAVLVGEMVDWPDPIGYDGFGSWFRAVFNWDHSGSVRLWESYVRNLERLSAPEYLTGLLGDVRPELEANLDFLYTKFPYADLVPLISGAKHSLLFYFSEESISKKQRYIKARLQPKAGVHGFVEEIGHDFLRLRIGNRQKLPLEIEEIRVQGVTYKPEKSIFLNGRPTNAPVEFLSFRFATKEEQHNDLSGSEERIEDVVVYSVPGSDVSQASPLTPWFQVSPRNSVPRYQADESALGSMAFLDVDHAARSVAFRSGDNPVTKDIVVPRGYRLTAGPGTRINLQNNARIVVRGPVAFKGNADHPVIISSSDGSGQGLLVIGANEESFMHNVIIENLRLSEERAGTLTAVVTFYESDVVLDNTAFRNNFSEDALNIVRSQFDIRESLFIGARSDAIDADFSTGRITGTKFLNSGNDAIDVSGTQIFLEGVTIHSSGDKAISIGEGSDMNANAVVIQNANIGIAVKDLSSLKAGRINILDSTIGFAVFQKKPEFGPASANVWYVKLLGVTEPYWVETGSSLTLEGSVIPPNRENLKDIIYPANASSENAAAPASMSVGGINSLR